jgi:hypothetical protein|tara:strand:- start:2011 stop:2274 length:264 start_codon:yes stop_codon:yes gene_type:complete
MKKEEKKGQALTEDEKKELNTIQQNYSSIHLRMGEIEISIMNLNERKKEIKNTFLKIKEKEMDFANKIEDKYGKGSISLETNEFIPQ